MSNEQRGLKEAAQERTQPGEEAAGGESEQRRPPGPRGRHAAWKNKSREEDGVNLSSTPSGRFLKPKSPSPASCSAAGESAGPAELRGTISRDYRGEQRGPTPACRLCGRGVRRGSRWKRGAKGRIPPRSPTNGSLSAHIRTSRLPVTFER